MPREAFPPDDSNPARWWRRLGWLVLLWAAGVGALAVVAFALRLVMGWAGLSR